MPDEQLNGFSKRDNLTNEDYYLSAEGFIVFTEIYLRKRGYCCKSGCRHCPYGFDPKTDRIKNKK